MKNFLNGNSLILHSTKKRSKLGNLSHLKPTNVMKKSLLTLVVIFSYSILSAQDISPFRFGLKASPNIGWLKPDTRGITANGSQGGFGYGLMADFTLGNSYNYALSSGIELLSNSGTLKFPDIVAPVDSFIRSTNSSEYSYRYVAIPLTIKMKTNEIGYTTYFANFGLSTGLRVRSRQTSSNNYGNKTLTAENVDVLAQSSAIRIAMVIGGGIEYNFHGKTALIAGLSFNNGFTNIFNKKYYELNDNGQVDLVNNLPTRSIDQKAISNFISLDIGIMF